MLASMPEAAPNPEVLRHASSGPACTDTFLCQAENEAGLHGDRGHI